MLTFGKDCHMCNEWMIEVLRDLREVSMRRGMIDLAEILDDTIIVAAVEQRERGADAGVTEGYDSEVKHVLGTAKRNEHSQRPTNAC